MNQSEKNVGGNIDSTDHFVTDSKKIFASCNIFSKKKYVCAAGYLKSVIFKKWRLWNVHFH